ncbi:hypothetical protein [Chitinophaga qingshengii]|uniref:ABC transporter permease n=1 Tax=Chitinophaga qingshengii TaxID=1569794 RepID=A0ABR7TEZ3_9BACT|nr:hypothetical protein [Chitinophaga qingshengii]MBC9928866.1 hypothetical protein [Chitinophaga qingshengii]
MKLFFKVALSLKRFGFIIRLIGIVIGFSILSTTIRDLKFSLLVSKAPVLSIAQLSKMKVEDIPLYFKVDKVTLLSDNFVGQYKTRKHSTEKTLKGIYFPVYDVQALSADTAAKPACQLIVHDEKVDEKKLQSGDYFGGDTFSVEGRFGGSYIDSDTRRLLEREGHPLADNCILIEKGDQPLSTAMAIMLTLIFGTGTLLLLASLLPASNLQRKSGIAVVAEPETVIYHQH